MQPIGNSLTKIYCREITSFTTLSVVIWAKFLEQPERATLSLARYETIPDGTCRARRTRQGYSELESTLIWEASIFYSAVSRPLRKGRLGSQL